MLDLWFSTKSKLLFSLFSLLFRNWTQTICLLDQPNIQIMQVGTISAQVQLVFYRFSKKVPPFVKISILAASFSVYKTSLQWIIVKRTRTCKFSTSCDYFGVLFHFLSKFLRVKPPNFKLPLFSIMTIQALMSMLLWKPIANRQFINFQKLTGLTPDFGVPRKSSFAVKYFMGQFLHQIGSFCSFLCWTFSINLCALW